jgi:hypothetical protein
MIIRGITKHDIVTVSSYIGGGDCHRMIFKPATVPEKIQIQAIDI